MEGKLKIIVIKAGDVFWSPARFMAEDVIDALSGLGHEIETIDMQNPVLLGDVIDRLDRFSPDSVLTLNEAGFISPLCSIMEERKIFYVSWLVDRFLSYDFLGHHSSGAYYVLFDCERANVEKLKRAGFSNPYFLPLATNPKIFKKLKLSFGEEERYGCNLSFAGFSRYSSITYWEEYMKSVKNHTTKLMLEEAIRLRRADLNKDICTIVEEVESSFGYSFCFTSNVHKEKTLERLLAAVHGIWRKEWVTEASFLGLYLYGDSGWGKLMGAKANYRGEVQDRVELSKLCNATKINLNIPAAGTAFNLRLFDVLSCGGFVLSYYTPDLEELFSLDNEIVSFKDKGELKEKVEYYLSHPGEREDIARRGHELVLREHTYRKRMQEMIDILRRTKSINS